MTWSFNDKCPHCGHRAAIHSGRDGQTSPGKCWEKVTKRAYCPCPGWHPELEEVAA